MYRLFAILYAVAAATAWLARGSIQELLGLGIISTLMIIAAEIEQLRESQRIEIIGVPADRP